MYKYLNTHQNHFPTYIPGNVSYNTRYYCYYDYSYWAKQDASLITHVESNKSCKILKLSAYI